MPVFTLRSTFESPRKWVNHGLGAVFRGTSDVQPHPPRRGGRAAVAERVRQWTGEWKVPRSRRSADILIKKPSNLAESSNVSPLFAKSSNVASSFCSELYCSELLCSELYCDAEPRSFQRARVFAKYVYTM